MDKVATTTGPNSVASGIQPPTLHASNPKCTLCEPGDWHRLDPIKVPTKASGSIRTRISSIVVARGAHENGVQQAAPRLIPDKAESAVKIVF
jgi:hypothetical protein